MPKVQGSYYMNESQKKNFKVWLVQNDSNINDFATKCGVTRQYISGVVNGKFQVTPRVVETFKKGGYILKD